MDWGIPVGANASVRSPGLFAFWGGENLQAPVLETLSDFVPPAAAEKFALEYFKCTIFLTSLQNAHADGSRNEISELQTGGIHLFCGKDDVKWQLNSQTIRTTAHPAKLNLNFCRAGMTFSQ
jgi:hypothetical protein